MWNPFKTLSQRDSARLRRLEGTVEDLESDVERILVLTNKINARLRQRARRAIEAGEPDGDSDDSDSDRPEFVAPLGGDSSFGSVTSPDQPQSDRSGLRNLLRQRARQRGLLPPAAQSS